MNSEFLDDKIGQETEKDIKELSQDSFSEAVLWSTDWTTETLISQLNKGNIELSPSFQRRDAWKRERKSKFIESIFLGLPIPQIILAERKSKRGSYMVIDGKQRLLSIKRFVTSSDNLDFIPLKLKGLKILSELNGKGLEDIRNDSVLSHKLTAFENHTIRTVIIKNWKNEDYLYTIFLRLNTGSLPLSPQELRQALNPGEFINFVDEFSINSAMIKKLLKIDEADYRMRDVELAVRYFSFKNYFEAYKGNLKIFLDNSCASLNQEWKEGNSEKIKEQSRLLEKAIEGTITIFEKNAFHKCTKNGFTNLFNRAVYDIMVFYFSMPQVLDKAIAKKEEIVAKFIEICKNDNDFVKSFETSTKNIDQTIKRYNTWGEALKEIVNLDFNIPTRTDKGIMLS